LTTPNRQGEQLPFFDALIDNVNAIETGLPDPHFLSYYGTGNTGTTANDGQNIDLNSMVSANLPSLAVAPLQKTNDDIIVNQQTENSFTVTDQTTGNEYTITQGANGTSVQYVVSSTGGTGSSQDNALIVTGTVNQNGSGTLAITTTDRTTGATNTNTQAFATAAQEYGEVGSAFGSSLGRILAGNNAFAQISTSTVLGALGEQVAAAIGVAGAGADAEQTINTFLDGDETGPVGSVIGNGGLLQSLESGGAGAVSAYLFGELVGAIGLKGAPAQIVSSLGSQTVSQVANNLITGAVWDSGITLAGSLGNVAGGFIGSELANLVYSTSTVQGEEGAAVGGAVGGALGTISSEAISEALFGTIVPGAGVLIGVLVGDIIGGLVGDTFGQSHVSHIAEAYLGRNTSSTGPLTFNFTTSSYQNGPIADATWIGTVLSDSLNTIVAEVGGTVVNASGLTSFGVGVNAQSGSDANLLYYYDSDNVRQQVSASNTTIGQVLDYAELRELSEMVFSGGDPYAEMAIDATLRSSYSPTLTTLSGDLQIVQDYETYEANRVTINALMAANPTSDFTASWVAELAVAAEMGLGTSVQGSAGNDVVYGGMTGTEVQIWSNESINDRCPATNPGLVVKNSIDTIPSAHYMLA